MCAPVLLGIKTCIVLSNSYSLHLGYKILHGHTWPKKKKNRTPQLHRNESQKINNESCRMRGHHYHSFHPLGLLVLFASWPAAVVFLISSMLLAGLADREVNHGRGFSFLPAEVPVPGLLLGVVDLGGVGGILSSFARSSFMSGVSVHS